jgi:hypothetical protein
MLSGMAGSSPAMTILWELILPQVCPFKRKMAGTELGHLHFITSRVRYGAACAFAAAMSASLRNDITVTLRVR